MVLLDPHFDEPRVDLLLWMRQTPELELVTVVILSATDEVEAVSHAYRLGVRSYLVKPVAFDALPSVVRDLGLPWLLA